MGQMQQEAIHVHKNEAIKVNVLVDTLDDAVHWARLKLEEIQGKAKDEINLGDMFGMQLLMNKVSQTSEMASAVVAATHGALINMARNIK